MKKSLILLSLVAASSLFAEVVYVHNVGSSNIGDYQYKGQKKAILIKEQGDSLKKAKVVTVKEQEVVVNPNPVMEDKPMIKVVEKPVLKTEHVVMDKKADKDLIAKDVKPKTAAAIKLVARMDADRMTCKELKCIHDPSDSNTIARYNTGVSAALAYDNKLAKYATMYTNNIAKAQKERAKISEKFEGYYDLEMISRKVVSSTKTQTVIDGVFKVVNNPKSGTINVRATMAKKWDKIGLRDVVITDINVK